VVAESLVEIRTLLSRRRTTEVASVVEAAVLVAVRTVTSPSRVMVVAPQLRSQPKGTRVLNRLVYRMAEQAVLVEAPA
jgi:hypothetical protein